MKPTLAVMTAVVAAVVAACGVPIDPAVRNIDSVPDQLMATTSRTTTTTTTTTTTIVVVPTAPPTSSTTTTTIVDQSIELIPLYFVNGDRFVEERRLLPADYSLLDVVLELAKGPQDGEFQTFPTTFVNFGDVVDITKEEGLATVELSPRFNDLTAAEQRRLVGQLVLTLGSQRGVGQVRFRVAGNSLEVPQGDGTFSTDPLSRDSFLGLVDVDTPIGENPTTTFSTSVTTISNTTVKTVPAPISAKA
jgi:Sporulation and spore germination